MRVPDAFREQLDRLVDAYLAVKEALAGDDLQAASSEADNLNKALSGIDMDLIKDDKQMQAWMTRQARVIPACRLLTLN